MFKHGFPPEWSTLKKLIWLVGSGIVGSTEKLATITGELVSFIANVIVPIKGLKVDIEPNQAGSGDPSPSNVRTVSGWTGCNVYKRSENIYYLDNINSRPATNAPYIRVVNGVMTIRGGTGTYEVLKSASWWKDNFSILLPPGSYYARLYSEASQIGGSGSYFTPYLRCRPVGGSSNEDLLTLNSTNKSFTLEKESYVWFAAYAYKAKFESEAAYQVIISTNKTTGLVLPEKYDIAFDWSSIAGTIYGGYYDILNGDLLSDVKRTRLSGTSTWYRQQINGQYYFCRSVNSWGIVNEAVACTHFKPMPTASALGSNPDCSIQLAIDRYYQMNVRYDAITTTSAFQQFLKDNEVYFFYKVSSEATHYDVGATSDYADFGEADSMILTE